MRFFLSIAPILLLAVTVFSQIKTPEVPISFRFEDSLQSVVVTTKNWQTKEGTAQLFQRKTSRSKWKPVGRSFAVVIGENGMAWGTGLHRLPVGAKYPTKAEGDGKAPAGIFMLTSAFGVSAESANLKLPYTRLVASTECVDDVKSFHYNKIVDRYQVGIFDWRSSEKMLAVGAQYEMGVFVAHNSERRKGDGSCIFLHIWRNSTTGTAGCTAMERKNIENIFVWLDAQKNPVLIQIPEKEYAEFQKSWNLPKNK